jgi:hypothetical protein
MFKKIGAVVTGVVLTASNAFAAVPADVTTALGDMKIDSLTVGSAFVVAVIALKALKLMKRA